VSEERWGELTDDAVDADVSVGTMFGSKGLRLGRRFFAIWWHAQRLVVKLPAGRIEQLLAEGRGEPFEPMEGRRMNGWVVLDEDVDWAAVAAEARAFLATLPR
jgi:hypothetical protein